MNLSKFDDSFIKAIIHIFLQFFLLMGLIILVQKKIFRFVIAIFLSIGLFTQLSYDSTLSVSLVMSIFNTSLGESVSFIKFNLITLLLTILFIVSLTISPIQKRNPIYILLKILGGGYLLFPAILSASALYSSEDHDDYIKSGLARGYSTSYSSFEYIISEDISLRLPALKTFKGITDSIAFFSQQVDLASTWKNVTSNNPNDDLLVLGIGESLRADNLGVYGYSRNTTPYLSQKLNSLSLFENTYSAGTNTWSSIPATLTKATLSPDLSKSIINLAKDAGYITYWISNHAQASHWDFSISAIAEQADHTFFFSNDEGGEVYDIKLLDKLKKIIANRNNKTLVVLHFYGSHMSFEDRYPEQYSQFQSDNTSLDQYDNSILYTDYVQEETIKLVSSNKGKYLFFADHGLGSPDGDIPLKHDVRKQPELSSLKVPLFTFPKMNNIDDKQVISLYYFECIFSQWSEISSTDLTENNYCNDAMKSNKVHFIDSNLKKHISSIEDRKIEIVSVL
jgi:heptose-I-phosphate ethanolaminephosphotransferase